MKVNIFNVVFIICLISIMCPGIYGFSFSVSKEIFEDLQIVSVNVKDIPSAIAVMQGGADITHLSARVVFSAEQQLEAIESKATLNNKPIDSVLVKSTETDKHSFDYIFHTFYNAFNSGVPAQLEKDAPVKVQKAINNIDTFNKEGDVWRNCLYALIKLINSDQTHIVLKEPFLIGMISKSGRFFNIVLDTQNFPHSGEKKFLLLEVAYKTTRIAGGDYFDTEIDPKNSYVSFPGSDKIAFDSIIRDWDLYRILLQLCDKFINNYFSTRKYTMVTGIIILDTKNNYKVTIDDRVYGGTWKSRAIDLIRFTDDLINFLASKSDKKKETQPAESNFLTWLRAKVGSWRWW